MRQVRRQRARVAGGVEHPLHAGGLDPSGQLLPDPAPGRVDHEQVRALRPGGAIPGGRVQDAGVTGLETHQGRVQAHEVGRRARPFDGRRRDLHPQHPAAWRRQGQGEAADAAEQVPHPGRLGLLGPVAGGGVERLGHGRVGLEEGTGG